MRKSNIVVCKKLSGVQKKLNLFFWALKRWNSMYNLTAINNFDEILCKHFSDSLAVYPYLQRSRKVLDVGTGAGFPGIPLSIIFPRKNFTLMDSNSKKVRFLLYLKSTLSLHNVQIAHSRFENYTKERNFDIIMTRAVNPNLDMFSHIKKARLYFKKIIIMKGRDVHCKRKELMKGLEILSLKLPKINTSRYLMIYNRQKIS